jgi:hypothetical protein
MGRFLELMRVTAQGGWEGGKFIAFSSPFCRELMYAGIAPEEVAAWTFRRN